MHHLYVRTYAIGPLADRLIAEVPVGDRIEAESIVTVQRSALGVDAYRIEIESVVVEEIAHAHAAGNPDCCWAGEGCCS